MNPVRAAVSSVLVALLSAAVRPAPVHAQERTELPAKDAPADFRLEEVFRVGANDSQPWQGFRNLAAAAYGGDGVLYLLDDGGPSVVAVRPDGTLAYRVGRSGDGPGEYRSPAGLAVLPDGRLAVWEARRSVFLTFGKGGEFLGEVKPDLSAALPEGPFKLDTRSAGGTPELLALVAHIATSRLGKAYYSGSQFVKADGAIPLVRVPLADGEAVREITRLEVPKDEGPPPYSVMHAFESEPTFGSLAGGRIAVHAGDAYRIRILRPDGSTERVIERPMPARPTTGKDRDAFMASLSPNNRRGLGGGSPGAARRGQSARLAPEPLFHPVIPPIQRITADGAQRIWVQRPDPGNATRSGPVDILTADGKYAGTLQAPGTPAAFGPDGLVVFLTKGDFDVPLARVCRIVPTL